MKVLVTGGCGYVGSVLVPKLKDHDVTVVDLEWFGNHIAGCGAKFIKADFRELDVSGFEEVIHLAGVANDPSGDLDPALTWRINALGTQQLADKCMRAGVLQFIYASSGSVYGISDAPRVIEETPLLPLSAYNETKMVAERCLLSYRDQMAVQVVRPATVCGYSPRMRLDVVVNMLVAEAMTTGKLTIKTPLAIRPHIHIEDMANLYIWMLEHPHLQGIYNAGFENYAVGVTAETVRAICDIGELEYSTVSNDPRSYRLNSDKILKTGFKPKYGVEDAIKDLYSRFASGELQDKDEWHTVKTLKRLQIA